MLSLWSNIFDNPTLGNWIDYQHHSTDSASAVWGRVKNIKNGSWILLLTPICNVNYSNFCCLLKKLSSCTANDLYHASNLNMKRDACGLYYSPVFSLLKMSRIKHSCYITRRIQDGFTASKNETKAAARNLIST